MDKQTGKFIARIAENLPDMDGEVMQKWIDKPMELQSFLLGLNPTTPKATSVPEPPLDFIIHVDRSVKPTYPDWFKKLENPELEYSGPAEYNLQNGVEQWLHDDQKNDDVVEGNTIHKYLKRNAIASCLNLQDGLAIQAKGIAVFRKLFADNMVFLWGSVAQNHDGNLRVPSLYAHGREIVVHWYWLVHNLDSYRPALRFGK